MAGDIQVGDNVGSALSAELKQLTSHNIPDTSDVDVRSDGHWHMATTETINALNGSGTVTLGG